MTQYRDSAGGFRSSIAVFGAAWPVLAAAILSLIGYIEVRTDSKMAAAIKEHDNQVQQRDVQYTTRVESDARRNETDRRLDEAQASDRVLSDRLGRIEAAISQVTVTVESIRQRVEDDRRASWQTDHRPAR